MWGKSSSNSTCSFEEQERQIRELLASGRWRKGRDLAKPLCKIDPKRFLPLLVQANIGLAKEMISHGLLSEAKQVIQHLQTIAPKEQIRPLEMDLASRLGNFSYTFTKSLELLSNPSSSLSASEKRSLADQLVLCFQPPSPSVHASLPPIPSEAAAIVRSLQAVSERKFQEAAELLVPIPSSSYFSHWKIFIKGLIAFHLGEYPKAEKIFTAIDPNTVPGQARIPYQLWLGIGPVPKDYPKDSGTIDTFCLLVQQPAVGGLLLKAERLWQEKKIIELYRVLREDLPDFPCSQPTWVGALTDFCLSAVVTLPSPGRNLFADFLDDIVLHRKTKNVIERMLLLRILCLDSGPGEPFHSRVSKWESFLDLYQQIYGENQRFRSQAYYWIAASLLFSKSSLKSTSIHQEKFQRADPNLARKTIPLFQKSIQCDPSNLDAHLGLAKVYESLKMTKELNRLFETMTSVFPEDKQVLTQATQLCIDRGAYSKAMNYITRAMEIDPLDPSLADLSIRIQMILARDFFQKRQTDKGRRIFDQLQGSSLILDHPNNFDRSRWTLLVRRGIQEKLYGDPQEAKNWLQQGRDLCPVHTASDLLADIVYRITIAVEKYRRSDPSDEFLASFRAITIGNASAAQATFLIRIYHHFELLGVTPKLTKDIDLIRFYMKEACRYPCTREEVLRLIESIMALKRSVNFGIGTLIQQVLKKDPKDPLLRFYQLRLDPPAHLSSSARRKKLEKMLQEATLRKELDTIQIIQRELQAAQRPEPLPINQRYDIDDDDWDEEDDLDEIIGDLDTDKSYDNQGDFPLDQIVNTPWEESLAREMLAIMYQEARPLMEMMIYILQNARSSELSQVKKQLGRDMPDFVFEFVLKTVRRPDFHISMLLPNPGNSPFSIPRQKTTHRKHPASKKPAEVKPSPKFIHKTLF